VIPAFPPKEPPQSHGRGPSDPPQSHGRGPSDPPPILGSWRNLYAAVLGNLALLVLLFWWITRVYG